MVESKTRSNGLVRCKYYSNWSTDAILKKPLQEDDGEHNLLGTTSTQYNV
jgi:hypothetical protein